MGLAVRDVGKDVNSEINVTPMVDVMLVLLIIFMVITPMVQTKVNVDLAKTVSAETMPDATHEDSVKVAITRDNRVYLGGTQVVVGDLGTKADVLLQNKPDKTVYIRADARAQYGAVMDAIDSLRTAGVDQVAFLTDLREQQPTKKPANGASK